jgi:hypothetical protein
MNIPNKKTILFFSISTLMINGCVSKHELRAVSPQRVVMLSSSPMVQTKNFAQPNFAQLKKSWRRFKPLVSQKRAEKKENCVDCYAAPVNYSQHTSVSKRSFSRTAKNPLKISYNNYANPIDYSKPPSMMSSTKHYGSYTYTEKASDKIAGTKSYESVNQNSYILPAISTMNNSYSTYDTFSNNSNISIQVGAFRKYAGAKRYVRRYRALSNSYRVVIKQGQKNNQPLYRVRIEGFKNKMEAKRFMNVYSISDAFLVRR